MFGLSTVNFKDRRGGISMARKIKFALTEGSKTSNDAEERRENVPQISKLELARHAEYSPSFEPVYAETPYVYCVNPIIGELLDNGFSNYDFRQLIANYDLGNYEAQQQVLRIAITYAEFLPLGAWEDGENDAVTYVVDIIRQYLTDNTK